MYHSNDLFRQLLKSLYLFIFSNYLRFNVWHFHHNWILQLPLCMVWYLRSNLNVYLHLIKWLFCFPFGSVFLTFLQSTIKQWALASKACCFMVFCKKESVCNKVQYGIRQHILSNEDRISNSTQGHPISHPHVPAMGHLLSFYSIFLENDYRILCSLYTHTMYVGCAIQM